MPEDGSTPTEPVIVPLATREQPARILLVEDNEMNRDMLSRRLSRKGYAVSVAVDGLEGIEMAAETLPDLILMDMSLPVMDGWEAARRLKAAGELCHIPIIALTAHAMSDDRSKAIAAGCDEYDTKPVEFSRLIQKMEALLRRPRATDTSDLSVAPPGGRQAEPPAPQTRSTETGDLGVASAPCPAATG